MDNIVSRLENLYTQTVNSRPNDLTVRIIPQVLRRAREVRAVFGQGREGGAGGGRVGAGVGSGSRQGSWGGY